MGGCLRCCWSKSHVTKVDLEQVRLRGFRVVLEHVPPFQLSFEADPTLGLLGCPSSMCPLGLRSGGQCFVLCSTQISRPFVRFTQSQRNGFSTPELPCHVLIFLTSVNAKPSPTTDARRNVNVNVHQYSPFFLLLPLPFSCTCRPSLPDSISNSRRPHDSRTCLVLVDFSFFV